MGIPESAAGSLRVGRVAAPLREQVASVLREAILDFRLRPGQRLIERDLIEQTGVSRATVREVLQQLTAEGLVTVIPQRGAIVVELTRKEVEDVYEVRASLEALAVRRFTKNSSDDEVAALRRTVEHLHEVLMPPDSAAEQPIQARLGAKDRYYDVLLDGCGNGEVRAILRGLQARARPLRATSLRQPDRPAQILAEVDEVLAAIERRDPEAAAAAARRHVERAVSSGLEVLANASDEAEGTPA